MWSLCEIFPHSKQHRCLHIYYLHHRLHMLGCIQHAHWYFCAEPKCLKRHLYIANDSGVNPSSSRGAPLWSHRPSLNRVQLFADTDPGHSIQPFQWRRLWGRAGRHRAGHGRGFRLRYADRSLLTLSQWSIVLSHPPTHPITHTLSLSLSLSISSRFWSRSGRPELASACAWSPNRRCGPTIQQLCYL